eukprot:ANDGO_04454.mRNA.1 Vegetative incompatibility protein HET-E-1
MDVEFTDAVLPEGFLSSVAESLSQLAEFLEPPPPQIQDYVDTRYVATQMTNSVHRLDQETTIERKDIAHQLKDECLRIQSELEYCLMEEPDFSCRLVRPISFYLNTSSALVDYLSKSIDPYESLHWFRDIPNEVPRPFMSASALRFALQARYLEDVVGPEVAALAEEGDIVHYPFFRNEHCLLLHILSNYSASAVNLEKWCMLFKGRTVMDLRRYLAFLYEVFLMTSDAAEQKTAIQMQQTVVLTDSRLFDVNRLPSQVHILHRTRPRLADARKRTVDGFIPQRCLNLKLFHGIAKRPRLDGVFAMKAGGARCQSASFTSSHIPFLCKDPLSTRNRVAACSSADSHNAWIVDLDSGTVSFLNGHEKAVNDIQFSCGGEFAVTCSVDGSVGVFDALAGTLINSVPAHSKNALLIATHGSNSRVFSTCGEDGYIRLFEIGDSVVKWKDDLLVPVPKSFVRGSARRIRKCHTMSFGSLEYQDCLIAGIEQDKRGILQVFDVKRCVRIGSWDAHPDMVSCISSSPVNPVLAATGGETDGCVRVWDLRSAQPCLSFPAYNGVVVNSVMFSPVRETLIASTRSDCLVHVYDTRRLTGPVLEYKHDQNLQRVPGNSVACTGANHAVFSPCGTRLFSTGEDSGVYIWDILSGCIMQRLMCPLALSSEHSAVVIGHNAEWVAACADNAYLHLWTDIRAGYSFPSEYVLVV